MLVDSGRVIFDIQETLIEPTCVEMNGSRVINEVFKNLCFDFEY